MYIVLGCHVLRAVSFNISGKMRFSSTNLCGKLVYGNTTKHRTWLVTVYQITAGMASRKHLRTKVTPDFHLTYSKNGGNSGVGIEIIIMDNFQYLSIKSYVVDVY